MAGAYCNFLGWAPSVASSSLLRFCGMIVIIIMLESVIYFISLCKHYTITINNIYMQFCFIPFYFPFPFEAASCKNAPPTE